MENHNRNLYFDWNHNELGKLNEILGKVESYISNTPNAGEFTKIANLFLFLIQNLPLVIVELEAKGLIRARPNRSDEIFSEEWQISYNSRDTEYIDLGRFNRKHESVFYGAIPTENEKVSMLLTGTLESCKEIFDKTNNAPFHDLTVGLWEVEKKFWVINLCFDNNHLDNNPRLEIAVKTQIEKFKSIATQESFDLIM